MGIITRKNSQVTVALRVSLHEEAARYTELLKTTVSALVNDIVESAFLAIRNEEPDRAIVIIDLVRQALGKDAHRKLGEKYHRTLFGLHAAETEQANRLAMENTSRSVPILKAAKQENLPFGEARGRVFGCVQSVLTEEVGSLYDTELMISAAQEVFDPDKTNSLNYFSAMTNTALLLNKTYGLFLKDHLAREVVREIPPQFLPS